MSRRFFDDQAFVAHQPVALGPGPAHHIARVLRMGAGETLTLFNGAGGEWLARLEQVDKKGVIACPLRFDDADRMAPIPVTLGLPLIKGERMDYAIQKATELGVAAICILETERTEVRLKGERAEKKQAHWQQVIISACEQCGLNRPPRLQAVVPLAAFLAARTDALKLIAHPGRAPLPVATLRSATSVALLTGPEGGFGDDELSAANDAGFQAFALGERVLRAETAPVALLGALWALL